MTSNFPNQKFRKTTLLPLLFLELATIISHFGISYGQECLPHKATCKVDGSLGWCCSTLCYVLPGQAFGFCTNPGDPICKEDGESCHYSGTIGFCCSGTCEQTLGEELGVCRNATANPKPTSSNSGGLDLTQTLGIAFGVVAIVLLGIISAIGWLVRKKRSTLTEDEIRAFIEGISTTEQNTVGQSSSPAESSPYDKNYEICESDFTIDHSTILGSGEFSIVMKGYVRGKEVAAKTMAHGKTESEYLKSLLVELKILIHVGNHQNIASLIGANTTNLARGSCYIFLEFCQHGSLENYLRAHKSQFENNTKKPGGISYVQMEAAQQFGEISPQHLFNWSEQIAGGMNFLTNLNIIHGDLAARNILLTGGLLAKISDFGLSKRLYSTTKFIRTKDALIPWRHLAPESLSQLTFSSASDVWSFGITIWEIWSLGDMPYPGLQWSTQFVDCLTHNMRPMKPAHATDKMYGIMSACWSLDPELRPSFQDLVNKLSS